MSGAISGMLTLHWTGDAGEKSSNHHSTFRFTCATQISRIWSQPADCDAKCSCDYSFAGRKERGVASDG
jgi:hypothetical protein